jgi:phage terminase Nu1 subunit (DNA packaging protein)
VSEDRRLAEQPPFLDARELAEALVVSVAAIRAWQRQGMPSVPLGRLRRYVRADVVAWHARRDADRARTRAARSGRQSISTSTTALPLAS